MRPDDRNTIIEHFEKFLEHSELHPFEPTLRHGDFGSGNILYNQRDHSISGIIDFSSAGLGDPAIDIAAAMNFGESFFNYYYDTYPGIKSLIGRANFYKGTFALQEALYGMKHDDHDAFDSSLKGIKPYLNE